MKRVLIFLLVAGVILRILFHFIYPAFNIDEIDLGNNIKRFSFIELLYPFENYQSAPPLYLWLQKLILVSLPFSFWIEIKILSFIASIVGIYLFFLLLIKENKINIITVLLFSIFLFNPFILYNSLTVKQYGIDLVGILLLLNFYDKPIFKKYSWIFFMFWCLISNIGLFGCAGFLIFSYFNSYGKIKFRDLFEFVKSNLLNFMAPLPYVAFFIWYMQQEGALELKNFMVTYWSDSFIPLNFQIFEYTVYLVHQFWIYFYNAYEIWGVFLMVITASILTSVIKRKSFIFKTHIYLLACILLVHTVLNILQLYPLSDRLFLYMAPFFILLLGAALDALAKQRWLSGKSLLIIGSLTVINTGLYFSYLPFKNNDVVQLYKTIEQLPDGNTVYLSPKASKFIERFNDFVDYEFKCDCSLISLDNDLLAAQYIVSKVHQKVKPNRTSAEEWKIRQLVKNIKIKQIDQVAGYNIYSISK